MGVPRSSPKQPDACRRRPREIARLAWPPRVLGRYREAVPQYRLHDHTGDEVGLVEHPAPNLEPGDVLILEDGREALVTARIEAGSGPLAALLEVAFPSKRHDTDLNRR